MSTANLKIVIDADLGNTRQELTELGKDLKEVGQSGEDMGDKMGKAEGGLSGALQGVKGFLALGVVSAAGRALFSFGQQAIMAASDVEEMSSKFRVVFGEEAPRVEQALAEMGDEVNRSRFDLMSYSSTIQDTLVPMGFARDHAADLSVSIAGLAVDIASFNNANDADVLSDLQSALVGNGEVMKKYGVILNETTTKAKALEMGLGDANGQLTEQEKVTARLQVVLDGTTDAQGDAARTADSFANSMKGLEAAWQDVLVVVGNEFLPLAAEVVSGLTDQIKGFMALRTSVSEAGDETITAGQSYDDYVDSVSEGSDLLNWALKLQDENWLKLTGVLGLIPTLSADIVHWTGVLTEEEYNQAAALAEAALQGESYDRAMLNAAQAQWDVAIGAPATVDGIEDIAEAAGGAVEPVDGLKLAMSGLGLAAYEAAQAELFLKVITGELTGAAASQAFMQLELQQAVKDGIISWVEYAMIIKDGEIATEEYNEALGRNADGLDDIEREAIELRQELGGINSELGSIPDKVTSEINIKVTGDSIPNIPTGGGGGTSTGSGAQAFARGADFMVPYGYPNDSYGPFYVQSGERVQVTPAGSNPSSPNDGQVVIDLRGAILSGEQEIKKMIHDAMRSAAYARTALGRSL